MAYVIKFTVSSNEDIGYPSKEKFELLYGLCWQNIDLLGENRMCGMIICHCLKTNSEKKWGNDEANDCQWTITLSSN